MDYIRGVTRNQGILFPETVEDYITEDNPVRFIDAFVSSLKRGMNQGYCLVRGLDKVGAEMSLTVLSYNLKRVINILGVKKLIAALT